MCNLKKGEEKLVVLSVLLSPAGVCAGGAVQVFVMSKQNESGCDDDGGIYGSGGGTGIS